MTYLMGKGQAFGREIESHAGIDFACNIKRMGVKGA